MNARICSMTSSSHSPLPSAIVAFLHAHTFPVDGDWDFKNPATVPFDIGAAPRGPKRLTVH